MTTTTLTRPASVPQAPAGADELPDELTIVVTQADIDNGEQRMDSHCAIALAAQRLTSGGRWSMSIPRGALSYQHRAKAKPKYWYWYSDDAGRFAAAFDRDRTSVQPTQFVFRRQPAA